ncbi:MarR family transcriptional regulator [Paenibacillus nanensis]|uniref:MarR family transcriptional regulator n=1 Tax=Paenibacillus nanensis TaxID=393251 RepID=A0A3A1V978_9BACL|nr:MarR family transcriptional regulator [Paenibacillus nanensis]RIX53980.1 MarR family transcriptional regulator [Paenibacillus nanensis]
MENGNEQDLPILSVGFLMGVAYRKLSAVLHHKLRDYDLTPEQWSVLYTVDQSQGLIQKEIAERSHKDKPTTTRILDQLEKKGLIHKQVGENDRRSFLVFTTEKGKEVTQATTPIEDSMTDELRAFMSEPEIDMLRELLLRIHHHLGTKQ